MNRNWFALYTKPRHEFKAAEQLSAEEIEYYLPTITLLKKWSDRNKKVTEPLFRGYIFIYANEAERIRAVEQKAVIKTIFFNGVPAKIHDEEIESLKVMLTHTSKVDIFDGLVKGNKVKITSGPFTDVEGVVYSVGKGEDMLAVSIEMLNRSVIVALPKCDVEKL